MHHRRDRRNFRFQDKNKFNRTLNRIRTIIEKQRQAHEQDSWTKLIRVLTHEIMNTVSPIASLSDVMAKSVDENGQSEPDLMIYADEGQISQILINLIKNALQAGAKHIDISARMGKEDDVIIQVANDGAPIPVSAQEQIFVPFYTTKKEGSGIGLSLARQIMRQHNGTIDLVRSDVNQTVFQLIFR